MPVLRHATIEAVREVESAGGSVAFVHVAEIDTDLVGKTMQVGHIEIIPLGKEDVRTVIAERFPGFTMLASPAERGQVVERMLIEEDLREIDTFTGKVEPTERAKALERGEPDPGKRTKTVKDGQRV